MLQVMMHDSGVTEAIQEHHRGSTVVQERPESPAGSHDTEGMCLWQPLNSTAND